MSAVRVRVDIQRRAGLSDPEGVTAQRALHDLGYEMVDEIHFGKTVYLTLDADDGSAAASLVEEMCARLLANPVIEDYVVEVVR